MSDLKNYSSEIKNIQDPVKKKNVSLHNIINMLKDKLEEYPETIKKKNFTVHNYKGIIKDKSDEDPVNIKQNI